MNMQITANQPLPPTPHDERILVVAREHLFPHGVWQGIHQVDFTDYLARINTHKEYLWRSVMEEDLRYKQIIPYLIFTYQNRYFVMQRKPNASATALQNKFSLGIGGHIRQEDMHSSSLFDWAQREFNEEVTYQGNLTFKPLGIINDDSNAIGAVHLGFAILVEGDSAEITIKDEHKSGALMTLEECALYHGQMETWSQLVMPLLP